MSNETQMRILKSAQFRCVLQLKRDNLQRNNLFKQMKILEIKDLVKLDILKMAYKFINKQLPDGILHLFPKQVNQKYQTRNRGIPNIDKYRSAIFSKSFIPTVNKVWISASKQIKNAKSLHSLSKIYNAEKFS